MQLLHHKVTSTIIILFFFTLIVLILTVSASLPLWSNTIIFFPGTAQDVPPFAGAAPLPLGSNLVRPLSENRLRR